MKYIFLFLSIFMFFTGCSSHKQKVVIKAKELPSWYLKPKQNDKNTLYATGEGKDRQEAIQDALNILSSYLSVHVSSKFSSKVVQERGFITSEINSDVSKIRITSYDIVKAQEFSFERYIVLIKCEKKKLFKSLKKELDQKFDFVEKDKDKASSYNIVKQFKICKEAKNSLKDVKNTLIVLSVLDDGFDSSKYIEKLKDIERDYEKLQSLMSFSVEADSSSQMLKEVLLSGLSAKSLQVLGSGVNSMEHLKIEIRSKVKHLKSYGFFLSKFSIFITVKDYKNTIIGSNKLNITGQSVKSYEIAEENVSQKLYEKMQKDGVEKIIGLSF